VKIVITFLIVVLGFLLAGLLLVALTVLAATGVGWLLCRFLPFSLYEATLLSLIALLIPLYSAIQFFRSVPFTEIPELEDDEWVEEEEEDDTEEYIPSIPRWRQPIKRAGHFKDVNPDDRCPCGSGRKYKNCHGRKAG
jgi:hypothetical protein